MRTPMALADEWKEACTSHDLNRIIALYSDDVVFKSPRVRTIAREESGILHGKSAVTDYWRRLLELRPGLMFAVGDVFAGVDSVALEYRVTDEQHGIGVHGIEFMTLDTNGLVTLAVGNDVVR